MKKTYNWAAIALILAIIITRSSIVSALLLFLLMGIVPGTDISLSSGAMLVIIATISWILIFRFTPIVRICSLFAAYVLTKAAKHTKAHLPKRRYGKV